MPPLSRSTTLPQTACHVDGAKPDETPPCDAVVHPAPGFRRKRCGTGKTRANRFPGCARWQAPGCAAPRPLLEYRIFVTVESETEPRPRSGAAVCDVRQACK